MYEHKRQTYPGEAFVIYTVPSTWYDGFYRKSECTYTQIKHIHNTFYQVTVQVLSKRKNMRMKAMTYRGPYHVRMTSKPMPEIEHPEDVIVQVRKACICGSDLHLYHGLVPDTRIGSTFGHEFIGEVVECGPLVDQLRVGDRVLVPFNIACGTCYFCRQGLYANCHESNAMATAVGGVFGYSHLAGGFDGGQAEFVRVPYANFGPVRIPNEIDDEDALLLTDVCPTGYQAAEMGGIRLGDTVVVFGAGPIGIMAARSAWLFGAGRVIVLDELDYRLDFVKKFAHCEAYNFRSMDDPVVFIKHITDGIGADVVIDAVGCEASGHAMHTLTGRKALLQSGAATALHWAINAVRKGGNVSIVGVYGPTGNLVPIGNVVNKGITIRANQTAVKRHIPKLIEHIQNGLFKPSEMFTHRFALEDIPEAYRIFSTKKEGCIKPLIIM